MKHSFHCIILLAAALGVSCSAADGGASSHDGGTQGAGGRSAGWTSGGAGAIGIVGTPGGAGATGVVGTPGDGGGPGFAGASGLGGAPGTGGFVPGSTGGTIGTGGVGATGGAPGAGGITDAAPTPDSAGTKGPYDEQSYKSGWATNPAFSGATIWYPTNGPTPASGVSVVPGFVETQLVGWGEFLASHGFIVITVDTLTPLDQPSARAVAVMGGLATLKAENQRAGSPIAGKLNVNSLAIMGHSMGGGGTLEAANASSNQLKAAIPICPWDEGGGGFGRISVPTLIFAGQVDAIAPVADHAQPFYLSLSPSLTRAFVEMSGADHFVANNPLVNKVVARIGLSWLELYVNGDQRYQPLIARDPSMSQFLYQQ